MRYFEKSIDFAYFKVGTSLTNVPSNEIYSPVYYLVQKRATPTLTITGFSGGNNQCSRVDTGADLGTNSCDNYLNGVKFFVRRNALTGGGALTIVQGVVVANYFSDAEL
jgi:hypothetical protein